MLSLSLVSTHTARRAATPQTELWNFETVLPDLVQSSEGSGLRKDKKRPKGALRAPRELREIWHVVVGLLGRGRYCDGVRVVPRRV